MELYQLRSLIVVAETGNFTRASAQLNITQPALSQQIINLEKELDHKLLHRLGRRAVLTDAGRIFLERARRILLEADNAVKEVRDQSSAESLITVGAIPSVAPYIIPALIAQARLDYPQLQIHAREDFRADLVQAVLEGSLDLAVVATPVRAPALAVESLMREPLLLAVGVNHRFAQSRRIKAADLASETFVMLGSSSSLTEQVRQFCGDHQFQPRIGYRCAQLATVKSLVTLGVGIAILPRIARSSKDDGNLVYLHLEDTKPERELVIIRHLQSYQSRGVSQFLTMLRAGAVLPTR
ncbi:MAG: LysR family transcriptional regulator [Opitutaceae bacterium]|nr:LysR family transcriptional regulator [Opitutaceae bacterium]